MAEIEIHECILQHCDILSGCVYLCKCVYVCGRGGGVGQMIYVLGFCQRRAKDSTSKSSYLETDSVFTQTPMFYFYSFLRSGIWAQVTFRDGFDHEDASQRSSSTVKALSTHREEPTANTGTEPSCQSAVCRLYL